MREINEELAESKRKLIQNLLDKFSEKDFLDESFNYKSVVWDTVIENMSNMVLIYDNKYKIKKVNSAICKFLDMSEEDLINKNLYNYFNKNLEYPNSNSCPIVYKDDKINFYKLYCYVYNESKVFWIHDIPLKTKDTKEVYGILRIYTEAIIYADKCKQCLKDRGCNVDI
jgi:PAS domain-containing protein